MYYLKITLFGTLRNYNQEPDSLSIERFYLFVVRVLEKINYYSTQAVQIPRSSRTIKQALIKDDLKKYVTHSHILKYKYFPRGVIGDFHSVHFLQLTEETNNSGLNLLRRSAFQIFTEPHAIAKLLYFNKIYAPLKLKTAKQHFFNLPADLYLIGFTLKTEYGANGEKKIVQLFYSNPNEQLGFVKGLSFENFLTSYSDDWIKDSRFKMDLGTKMFKQGYETLSISFERDYLHKMNNLNSRSIKKRLSIRKPNFYLGNIKRKIMRKVSLF